MGDPGARLKDLVMTPHEVLLSDGNLRINHTYYITKMILPALKRLFVLVGVDVHQWYRDMTKPVARMRRQNPGSVTFILFRFCLVNLIRAFGFRYFQFSWSDVHNKLLNK